MQQRKYFHIIFIYMHTHTLVYFHMIDNLIKNHMQIIQNILSIGYILKKLMKKLILNI